MIDLKFNLQDAIPGLKEVTEEHLQAANEVLVHVGQFALNRLKEKASDLSEGAQEAFIAGLEQPESFKSEPGHVTIQLVGTFANMVESGFGPFDMKVKMLAGPSAKTGKNGAKYVDVPFTWGNPLTKRGGAQKLPQLATQTLKDAITDAKNRLQSGQSKFAARGADTKPVNGKFAKESGAMVQGEVSAKGIVSVGNATTVRRMSENSPASKWTHPGMPEGLGAFAEVEEEVAVELERALSELER